MYLANGTLLILLGLIAMKDMTQRCIPNIAVLGLITLGIFVPIFLPSSWFAADWESAVAASGLAFTFFLPFYLVGLMGAGDVKLAAGLGMCVGLALLLPIFFISIGLAVVYAMISGFSPGLKKSVQPIPTEGASRRFQRLVPYGSLLCLATAVVLLAKT